LLWRQRFVYNTTMIIIRFPDAATEKQALGWLVGRFSFKTWANGDLMIPEEALSFLAVEGIRFHVEGMPRYEQTLPSIRNVAAPPIQ
jgi:hypothetical protein